jgi:hypothetical protein
VRQQCHQLASATRQRLNTLTGLAPICPDSPQWFTQMFAARLPAHADLEALKQQLYNEFRGEVPVLAWNHQKFIRVSFQGYNPTTTLQCVDQIYTRRIAVFRSQATEEVIFYTSVTPCVRNAGS